jgi:ribosomal protein S18 acetylase RimI-like enzyme
MVSVRKAKAKDVDAVHQLGMAVPEFVVNESTVTFWPKDVLSEAIASSDVEILVAEADYKVVGFVIANLNLSLRKAIIENVYVAPENRGNNIGDRLLAELLGILHATPIEYVSTLIPADAEEASKLYVTAGFSKGETFLWLDKSMTSTFKSD